MIRITQANNIIIPRGDTGQVVINLEGYTAAPDEVAVFAVRRNGAQDCLIYKVIQLVDNTITIRLDHDDTKNLRGDYLWDVRVIDGSTTDTNNRIVVMGSANSVHSLFAPTGLPRFTVMEVVVDV